MIATIEPWLGNQVAVYRVFNGSWTRNIIDTEMSLGHTAIAADLDGDTHIDVIFLDRTEELTWYDNTGR